MKRDRFSIFLQLFVITVAVCAAVRSMAQQNPRAAAPDSALQEIVVTGSRIAAPNAVSPSPIQAVSAIDIQASGKTDLSDILYQLPQFINVDTGQDLSNRTPGLAGPGGVTTADLRGLGANRTLVLIDGRRLGQGSPQTTIAAPAPNIDQIPTVLVERVEVLTGGASSVYGSDAIAGVVNFIMKKNFEGVQVGGQLGEDWHNNRNDFMKKPLTDAGYTPLSGNKFDGKSKAFDIIAGTNFNDGAGNITGYLTYTHFDPLASAERDYGQCQLTEVTDAAGNVIGSKCTGSSNSNRFTPLTGPNAHTRYSVLGNSFVPWNTVPTIPPALFNSQPFIYMQREDDRYLAGFVAHNELASYAKPYMEFSFMNDKTHQAVAPAAAFTTGNPNTGGPYFVNCANPFLSAQQQGIFGCTSGQIAGDQTLAANQVAVTIGRRNIEGGARSTDYEHTNYRAVVGMKGDFADAWRYDAYGQFYYVNFNSVQNKFLSYAKIDNALLVTGTNANARCLSGPPCVPWNIFSDGGVTQDALEYLYLLGTAQGSNSLRTLHADITGDFGKYGVKLPTARDGIDINFGWEHRKESVHYTPDDATNSGQLSGAGGTQEPLDNSISVSEEFVELRVPLAQELPFAKEVIAGSGFRHSNYSVSGGVNTYKFDLQWAPIPDIRFRGSYNRAIRAPSVSELFDRQNIGLIAFGNDPCAAPATNTLQQCLNTVTAAEAAAFKAAYGNGTTTDIIPQAIAGQLAQVGGGNPKLQPEKAKSYTVGVLFAPTAIPNLAGSVDFWQIRIEGEVGTYPANLLVTNCLQTGNPVYCSQVVRTSTDFSLQGATVAGGGYIVQTNQNIAAALSSGVDLQTSYKLNLNGLGSLQWLLNGSYLIHSSTTPIPAGGSYDCAGLYGSTCGVSSRWRHNLRTTWQMPLNVDASLVWRFIGKVGQDNNDPNSLLYQTTYGALDLAQTHLPNVSYFDLTGAWHVTENFDLRGGINNILDKDPPIITNPTLQGGGFPNTFGAYDILGRQLYLAFTAKF